MHQIPKICVNLVRSEFYARALFDAQLLITKNLRESCITHIHDFPVPQWIDSAQIRTYYTFKIKKFI
jgi:hypothetical protein